MRLKQTFAIALASAIIGCSTAPVMPQKPLEQIIAENVITPMDFTGVIYKLTKEEGIRQLSNLAMNNKYEDMWFYLPETEEWLDYGEGISKNSVNNPRLEVLLERRPNVKEVSNYHIHPAINLSMGGFYKEEYKNFQGALQPSYEDMEYFLQENEQLKQWGVKLKEAVVVDLGGYWVVNFETTDLDKMKDNLKNYDYLAYKYRNEYFRLYKRYKDDLKSLEVYKKSFIGDFEKQVKELGIDLKYYFL